jgi:hypothetical protein
MRRFSPLLFSLLVLSHQSAMASMIEDVLGLSDILNQLCGPRMDVVWVDESRQNPPCLMTYSPNCVETQANSPNSCDVVMHSD